MGTSVAKTASMADGSAKAFHSSWSLASSVSVKTLPGASTVPSIAWITAIRSGSVGIRREGVLQVGEAAQRDDRGGAGALVDGAREDRDGVVRQADRGARHDLHAVAGVGDGAPLGREGIGVRPAVLAAAPERDVGRAHLIEQVARHGHAAGAMDETGAIDGDGQDIERRIAEEDGDRGEVTQVHVGIDDHRPTVRCRLTALRRRGHRRGGRGQAAAHQQGDAHRHDPGPEVRPVCHGRRMPRMGSRCPDLRPGVTYEGRSTVIEGSLTSKMSKLNASSVDSIAIETR